MTCNEVSKLKLTSNEVHECLCCIDRDLVIRRILPQMKVGSAAYGGDVINHGQMTVYDDAEGCIINEKIIHAVAWL